MRTILSMLVACSLGCGDPPAPIDVDDADAASDADADVLPLLPPQDAAWVSWRDFGEQ